MSSYGRIEVVAQDEDGNAIPGVSVEIRKAGATVNGAQAGSPYTVYSPGGLVSGDTISLNTGSTTRTVSALSATSVTTGGGDLGAVSTGDRITDRTLPTVYTESSGTTSKPNPLTTDSGGLAYCYAPGGAYDLLLSGGGVTTSLRWDAFAQAGETWRANVYSTGSAVAWVLDTLNTQAAGDKLLSVRNATVEKFSVAGDGEITAGAAGATHSLTGSLAVSTSIAATTSVAATTTVTGGTGVTATTGDVQATAGFVNGKRYASNLGTALTTADFAISALWGATATKSIVAGSTDTRGGFRIDAAGAGVGADAAVVMTFKDGTFTTAPFCQVSGDWTNTSAAAAGELWTVNASATSAVFVHHAAPVAGQFYGFSWLIVK